MADPVTLTLAGVGLASAAGGAITQAYGAAFQGAAQSAQANYQAGVARVNATLAAQDRDYALNAGEVPVQEAGLRGGQVRGGIVAGQGAGNIRIGSGSASEVVKSQTEATQENEAILSANAVKEAFGFDVQRAKDVAQAGVFDVAAKTARTAATINIASSIIGGAGQVSTKWLQGQSSGVFPSNADIGSAVSGGAKSIGGWASSLAG